MNMKRILSLALMALVLCLPVWAMAETIYLDDIELNPLSGVGHIPISQDVTLSQRNPQRIDGDFALGVRGNVTVTLKDVNCGMFEIWGDGSNITFNLEGTNTLTTNESGRAALMSGPDSPHITIRGNGILNCTSAQNAGIFTCNGLTIQSGTVNAAGEIGIEDFSNNIIVNGGSVTATGKSFAIASWNPAGYYNVGKVTVTNPELSLKAGADAASAVSVDAYGGEKYLKISPVPLTQNQAALPKTGDDSNVILWSALACISLIGMTMLAYKRKAA